MSLALYRKYRPSTFVDVIGQEHVTTPLSNALTSGQIHHAYLFSGPRGCGKTSSARIMARSLNCEKGPTPNPCGECQSCKYLVANGPGSLDVIELDAATHGLVDDARDLRDKAFFAPVQSRYKIYIIDEAHQLGPGAANALLKVVEEPPAHGLGQLYIPECVSIQAWSGAFLYGRYWLDYRAHVYLIRPIECRGYYAHV